MKKHTSLACLVLLLAFGTRVPAEGYQQGDPQYRLRLRENISTLYLLRLTRALELTEEQTAKVYPVLTRVERDKAGIQRRMGQDLRDLRAELAKSRPDEENVLKLAARIREDRRAIRQKDNEAEDALDGVLTPLQKGKYVVFAVDFLRGLGENLERARGLRAPTKRSP